MTKWTPTQEARPDHNSEVMVITPGGDERELYFASGLWFLPDRSMYVYFLPSFWRYKDGV